MAIRTTGVRFDLIARDSASRQFDRVGNSASKLERGFGRLGKAAAVAGGALAVGIGAGLAKAADQAVKFQTEMTRIQTQAGASAKDVQVLSKQVLELGKSTQQGPQELSAALYHLKSVGMDNVSAMKALKTASDLAAVGGANLESTTNALAGAWRTGIKGATNMDQAARTLNATIGAGNMTMDDMVAALGTGILPTAKTFGLTLSQVGSALALFTDEGVDSASAATRLRMSISLLAAPSKASEKQLKKIGLTGNALGTAMRSKDGLIAAITLLKDHLDKSGLSATQSAALLSRAFGGGKSSSAILSMVNNLDVLKKKQDQVNRSMDKFPAAVTAQRKTVQAQYDLIKSNIEVASIQIGTKLLPVLARVTQYVTKTALPAVGDFSAHLRALVPVQQIEGDFKTATGFVSDFFSVLRPKKAPKLPTPSLAMPTTKIPSTLKAPTTQGQQLGKQLHDALSGGLSDAVDNLDWGKLGKQVGAGLDKGFGWVTAHLKGIGDRIGKAIASVDWTEIGKKLGIVFVPFVIGVLDKIFTPLFTLTFWKKHWWDAIVAVISVIPFDEVFNVAGRLLKALPWGKLGDLIGEGLARIPWGHSLDWAKYLGKVSSDGWTAISKFSDQILGDFTRAFSTKFPKLSQWFTTQLDILPTRLGLIGLKLKESFGKAIDGLVEHIPGWKNKFVRFVYKYFTRYTIYQAGTQLILGLYNGITGKLSGLGKWINAHIVNPFISSVKSLFGIHSPSTVFAGIGGNLIAGLKSGVVSAVAGIAKWITNRVVSPVKAPFKTAKTWLVKPGKSIMSGLLSGLKSGLGDITSFLSGIPGSISKSLSGTLGAAKGALGKLPGLSTGGLAPIGQTAWVGEKGPELMQVTPKGTRIYNNRDSMAMARISGVKLPGYAAGTVATKRVSAAQHRVTRAEASLATWRHREQTAHSRARRHADQLQVEAAEKRLAAAKTELSAAKKLATASASVSNTLANGFLKALETGSAAAIASAVKAMNTKLQAAGAGSLVSGMNRTASKLESLASRRSSLQATIAKAQQYALDQSASLGDFLSLSNNPSSSVAGLISRMQASQTTAASFASEVAGLSKRGLSKTLLSQLADAGPGSQLASVLATASDADIAQLNRLAASQAKLTTSFGQQMADAMYDSGSQAGKGFLAGLKAQEASLQAEMDRLADGMVKAIKKKLGIHSPSTVARDQIGRQFVLGAAAGVRIHAPRAEAEAQRMADTMAAVRARSAAGRPAGAVAAPVQHVHKATEIHLHGAKQTSAEQAMDLARYLTFVG